LRLGATFDVMADNSAEMAFLNSMREQTASAAPQYSPSQQQPADDEDEEEDYDPSSFLPNAIEEAQETASNAAQTPYHVPNSQIPSRPTSSAPAQQPAAQTQQPKTLGGFLVDEDDEDEDEAPFSQSSQAEMNGLANGAGVSSDAPQRSVSQTPINTLPPTDVSIQKAQAQDASLVSTAPATDSAPFAPLPSQDGAASVKSPKIPVPSASKPSSVVNVPVPPSKKRLPGDVIGQLEDRITEDPRGDMDAWLSLISEHRRRNKLDEARSAFDRFFKVFPHAASEIVVSLLNSFTNTVQAEQWVAYANMELENDDFYRLEQIFANALMTVPNVQLWSIYLDYVRRRNNLTTDSTGQARQIVTAAFDFVLKNIGIDKDSGHLWQEFVNFVRSSPGIVGGNGWQDQQKADIMRKTFQQATTIPTSALQTLWKEYEQFETGLNKQTVSGLAC